MSVIEKLDSVLALAGKATPGPWLYRAKSNSWHLPPPEGTKYSYGESMMDPDEDYPVMRDADIDLVAALVALITEHGPAIRQAMIDAEKWRWWRHKLTCGNLSLDEELSIVGAKSPEELDAAIDARLASDSATGEGEGNG